MNKQTVLPPQNPTIHVDAEGVAFKTIDQIWHSKMAQRIADMDDVNRPDRLRQFRRAVNFAGRTILAGADQETLKLFVRNLLIRRAEFLMVTDTAFQTAQEAAVAQLNAESLAEHHEDWAKVEDEARKMTTTEFAIHTGPQGPFLLVMPDELEDLLASGVLKPFPAPAEVEENLSLRNVG